MKKSIFLIQLCALLALSSCQVGTSNKLSLIPVKGDKDFQYIDPTGKIMINPQFSSATVFREGLALVCNTDEKPKWGYIDENGLYIIKPLYLSATVFSEGFAWVVQENSPPSLINEKGEIIFTLSNARQVYNFHEGLAAFSEINKDGKEQWGFLNDKGDIVINAQFSDVNLFREGLCAVANSDDKWGYINIDGKLDINYQFSNAYNFHDGLAVVSLEEKFGVIDKKGSYVINPQFTSMRADFNKTFIVKQGNKYGWTDKEGKFLINPQFDDVMPFNSEKYAAVKSGDNYGFIDSQGKFVINPQFDIAWPFNGNISLVVTSNKYGLINLEGKSLALRLS